MMASSTASVCSRIFRSLMHSCSASRSCSDVLPVSFSSSFCSEEGKRGDERWN